MEKKDVLSIIDRKSSGKVKHFSNDRSKYLRQKFQQVAAQSLLKKGDGDQNLDVPNDKIFEIPKKIGITLNLSKMNLNEFPRDLLDKMIEVQYLYLEGNELTELPETFFQKLPSLKWLDLRNNALTSLPTVGLSNHSSLEVILLQGNRIRNLPVDLANVPSLKGLQTSGNPLTNVPYDCIAEGFSGVINHLKKLSSQNNILVPSSSQTVVVKPSTSRDESLKKSIDQVIDCADSENRIWDLDKLSQWRPFMKKKSREGDSDPKSCVSKNQKSASQKPKISVTFRSYPKAPLKPLPFKCGAYNRNRRKTTAAALHYLKMRKTRLGYKKKPITMAMLEEKARREAHIARVRETLEKQARKIQRLRDKEVLKSWRDHAKITSNQIKLLDNYQQYPSKNFASQTPFDTDPEFLNMLNRVDLYRSLREYDNKSKRIKKPKIRITALDLERQMNEIISKLQNLGTEDNEESSTPRTKQNHLCSKMSKILDIQKTLKQLQTYNSSMTGVAPIKVSKSKN